jgi:hypothetical protein
MSDRDTIQDPFTAGATVSLAVTTASASVALTGAAGKGKQQVRLYNAGTALIFYKIGASGVAAAVTDVPLPAGMVEVITVLDAGGSARFIAAIAGTGTATLYATVGQGI